MLRRTTLIAFGRLLAADDDADDDADDAAADDDDDDDDDVGGIKAKRIVDGARSRLPESEYKAKALSAFPVGASSHRQGRSRGSIDPFNSTHGPTHVSCNGKRGIRRGAV